MPHLPRLALALICVLALTACDLARESAEDGDNPLGPGNHDPTASTGRYRGVNLEVRGRVVSSALDELQHAGVEWIALTPFGWQQRYNTPQIRLRTTGVRWGETDEGLRQITDAAHARGIQVLIKPHLWLIDEVPGQWRGTVGFDSEFEWQQWEEDYRALALHYAGLAADSGAEMFSLGVELRRAVRERPEFWRRLATETRQVYGGTITYGANWDGEFEEVGFWDLLDLIGVHGYFPLTDRLDASVADLEQGWRPHLQTLQSLCDTYDTPVVFLEIGYRSILGTAIEPWNFTIQRPVDVGEQADAYEALFRTFWGQPWFGGLFLWQWHSTSSAGDGDGYSPQGKPAESVLTRWFTRTQ